MVLLKYSVLRVRFCTEKVSPTMRTYSQCISCLYPTCLVCSGIQSVVSEGRYLYTYKTAGDGWVFIFPTVTLSTGYWLSPASELVQT